MIPWARYRRSDNERCSWNVAGGGPPIIGAEVAAGDWAGQYADLVKRCMDWLYVEESLATTLLSNRLIEEAKY